MKHYVILLTTLIWYSSTFGAIVNNSTTSPSSEDSLAILFYSLDSLGNPTTADSLYLLIIGPDGSVALKDSMAISDSRVTSTVVRGKQFYSFSDQVSDLDGAGSDGVYAMTLLAKTISQNLLTPNQTSFQIVNTELSDQIARIGDSVLVRGGAVDSNRTERGSAVDSSSLVNWVWNTPQANHTTGGTFGRFLDAAISSVSSGSGLYSISVVSYDSSAAQVVPNVSIAVRNNDQTALIALGATAPDGSVGFNLDAATYIVSAVAPGYIFDPFDTIVVNGAGTDTVAGYQFNPGQPASPLLNRVWGYLYDVSGSPEVGATISASIPSGVVRNDSLILSPFAVSTTTDSTGYFYLDLYPSDSLDPSGTQYEITIVRTNGTILRQRLSIPDQASWRLSW